MESNNHDKSVFSKMVETKTVWIETEIIGGKKSGVQELFYKEEERNRLELEKNMGSI